MSAFWRFFFLPTKEKYSTNHIGYLFTNKTSSFKAIIQLQKGPSVIANQINITRKRSNNSKKLVFTGRCHLKYWITCSHHQYEYQSLFRTHSLLKCQRYYCWVLRVWLEWTNDEQILRYLCRLCHLLADRQQTADLLKLHTTEVSHLLTKLMA